MAKSKVSQRRAARAKEKAREKTRAAAEDPKHPKPENDVPCDDEEDDDNPDDYYNNWRYPEQADIHDPETSPGHLNQFGTTLLYGQYNFFASQEFDYYSNRAARNHEVSTSPNEPLEESEAIEEEPGYLQQLDDDARNEEDDERSPLLEYWEEDDDCCSEASVDDKEELEGVIEEQSRWQERDPNVRNTIAALGYLGDVTRQLKQNSVEISQHGAETWLQNPYFKYEGTRPPDMGSMYMWKRFCLEDLHQLQFPNTEVPPTEELRELILQMPKVRMSKTYIAKCQGKIAAVYNTLQKSLTQLNGLNTAVSELGLSILGVHDRATDCATDGGGKPLVNLVNWAKAMMGPNIRYRNEDEYEAFALDPHQPAFEVLGEEMTTELVTQSLFYTLAGQQIVLDRTTPRSVMFLFQPQLRRRGKQAPLVQIGKQVALRMGMCNYIVVYRLRVLWYERTYYWDSSTGEKKWVMKLVDKYNLQSEYPEMLALMTSKFNTWFYEAYDRVGIKRSDNWMEEIRGAALELILSEQSRVMSHDEKKEGKANEEGEA